MELRWFHAFKGRTVGETLTVIKDGPTPNPSSICTTKLNEQALGITPPHVYAYLGRTYEECLDACIMLVLSVGAGHVSPFDTGGLVAHIAPVNGWEPEDRRSFLYDYSWPADDIETLIDDYPTRTPDLLTAYLKGGAPAVDGPHVVWSKREALIWGSTNQWPAWTWELRCPDRLPTGPAVAKWTASPGLYPLLVKHIEDNPDQAEDLLPLLDSYFEGGASALHAAYLRGAVA